MNRPRTSFQDGSLVQATSLSVAAGAVAYGIVGLAYETFYDGLGVSPREVGFGYSETLITAAYGLLLYLLLFLGLALVHIPINFMALGLSCRRLNRKPSPAPRWWSTPSGATLVIGIVVLTASVALELTEVAVFSGLATFVLLSNILGREAGRCKNDAKVAIGSWAAASVPPRTFIWTAAIGQVAVVHLLAAALLGLGGGDVIDIDVVVGAVFVVLVLEPWLASWLLMRWYAGRATRGDLPAGRWFTPNVVALAATTALGVALAVLAAISATESSRAARDGRAENTTLDRLTNGRVDCVAPVWTASQQAFELPRKALFLGQAAGRIVLYEPGAGSIRLNAADVALLPVARTACDTSAGSGPAQPSP